jgi:hypothetical protein
MHCSVGRSLILRRCFVVAMGTHSLAAKAERQHRRTLRCLFAISLVFVPAVGWAAPSPSARASATYPFAWGEHDLTGPGAAQLLAAARRAQFVLIGEEHNDRDTPLFTRTLYAALRREDGYTHLVVEQDPLGAEFALAPGRRGDAAAIGAGLKTWPTLLGFASDQDLALLADAGAAVAGPDAIWGLEQAQSPVRYLEELAKLAPVGTIRADVERLLRRARVEDRSREDFARFLAYDRKTFPELKQLAASWTPTPGSRARTLLDGLVKSAEIYDDYVRAEADHSPALHYQNGTVREAWLKAQFTRDYRAASASPGGLPRALFKFGDNHIRRGVGSTGAWTLGTFVADLATFDSMAAYSILVVPIGSDVHDWQHLPMELRSLLPDALPAGPVLIDLAALRPNADAIVNSSPIDAREATRATLFGFDAIVVLPDSAPATWHLTGFRTP